MRDIPLRCECGAVRGTAARVSPRHGARLICYCDDCQTYAHCLGRPERILDAHGGTDVFQLTPAQLVLDQGVDQLACLRLSEHGLMRWYARCCRTPIANTLARPWFPFAGVIHTFMDHAESGSSRDDALGPPARVQARFATGDPPADALQRASLGVGLRSLRVIAGGFFSGAHHPSPFFQPRTGAPVAQPQVLSASLGTPR